ncbi:hypothetical protein V490_08836 [Pseudogymnoascus sp. VKM F-3557]|nr:hypothetical protein V490_08836 [Pseudogymnoascus sp. VKM F-3557]
MQASHENPSLLPPLFSQTFGTETVHITVGDNESKLTFTVHKDLIVSRSKFFSAMFDGNFLEAMTSSASFPDDDPSAFEVLMEWVYYDTLKSLGLNRNHTQAEARENIRKIMKTLGLADKYCIDELADRCMTILYHRSRYYQSCQLDFDMIIFIYAETGPISMARKYAATELAAPLTISVPNLRARSNTGITTAQEICEICKEDRDILDDLFKVVSGGSSRPRGPSYGVCQFHLHPKTGACPYDGMDEAFAAPPKDSIYCGCGRSRSACNDRQARFGKRCPAFGRPR